jgi:hypothetical protein
MIRKALIATATAGMLAAGSLAASTLPASASSVGVSGSIQFGGPGWSVQIGNPGFYGHHHNRHCRPIVKTVKYWKWGRPHWKQVVVGFDCKRRHHSPQYFPGFPGGPGWGGTGWGGPGWGGW